MVCGPVRVVELERPQAECLPEPETHSPRLAALRGDRAPGTVELFGAAGLGERLQGVQSEPSDVRIERGQGSGTADVRDPRAGNDLARDRCDRAVRDAEEDELGVVGIEDEAALREPGAHRRADAATRADDSHGLDHSSGSSSVAGYRAGAV